MSYDRRTLASDSPWAIVASLLMIFAAVMILAIIPSRLQGADEWGLAVSLLPLLPSAACICTAVMLVSRKNSLIPTAVPVAAVCFFIAASSVGGGTWYFIVCCLISTSLAALYLLAASGTLSARTPLLAVCAAAALWTLITVPLTLSGADPGAAVSGFAPAVCAAAIFCVGCGMRRGRLY